MSELSKKIIAKIEYGLFLNGIAMVNPKIGLWLSGIRGVLNAALKRDFWRMEILNDSSLLQRMESGIKTVTRNTEDVEQLIKKIFHTIAREELESAWLANRNVPTFPLKYENYEGVERYMQSGGRVVFLTSHYGSNILGIALLGKLGLNLLTMSSDFFMKNPMIPNSMKKFYSQKYEGLASYLNGGDVIPQEGNLKKFYRFLRDKGHVVILGDLPGAADKNSLWIDYFSKKRCFSPGAIRMAESEGAAIVSFVCKATAEGYTVSFSDVFEQSHDCRWYEGGYRFLEKHIEQNPELYYGIDLLPLFPILQESPEESNLSPIKKLRRWNVVHQLKKVKYTLRFGWKIGTPCFEELGRFDPNYYIDAYPDIAHHNVDPLAHYILYGKREGRKGYADDQSIPITTQQPSLLRKLIRMVLYIKNHPSLIKKFLKEMANHGFGHAIGRARSKMEGNGGPMANAPYRYTEPVLSDRIRQEMEEFGYRPLISIIMPVYNVDPKWLELAIKSIERQWYTDWELCIADDKSTNEKTVQYLQSLRNPKIKITYLEKNLNISGASNEALKLTSGDYVVLMDNDDELTPDALYEVVKAIHKGGEFIYSDEDKLEMDGTFSTPHFKPDFAPDMLLSQNYISHLGVIKKELINRVEGFQIGLEGAQDYDLYLKVLEHTDNVVHIPKVLYHWRKIPGSTAADFSEKSYAQHTGTKALANAFLRRNVSGSVENGKYPGTYKVRYEIIQHPLVSIIIPFKDKPELLRMCIESILDKSTYGHFEIIGISNNSCEDDTFAEMKRLEGLDKRICFYEYNVPFNYSRINNYAIERYSKGEQIILLNNDIEIITPEWIERLLEFSQRDDVGVVGAKLYYPNDSIQHAGVIIGLGGVAGHSHKYFDRYHPGYFYRLNLIQNLSAVTAACCMVKKSIYSSLDGLNEENLKIAFNDVDFCLRVREAGYLNIFTPYCEAYHHESISRGHEDTVEKIRRFETEINHIKKRHNKILTDGDPFYSPNLTLSREDFSLR